MEGQPFIYQTRGTRHVKSISIREGKLYKTSYHKPPKTCEITGCGV